MKKTIQKLSLILAVSLTILVGCSEFFDKIDNFNVGITNAIFEQTAVIELKDYFGDQKNVMDTNFTITFGGADADKLVSEAGEFNLTETDGFIQLGVNPNKSTGVKELNFDVTVSGGDYVTYTYPITLKDTTSYVPLTLLNKNTIQLNGVDSASKTATLTNNATVAELDVETSNTNSLSKSTVKIPSGTTFKNAAGNTLTGTNLNVYVENTDANGITQYLSDYTFKNANGNTVNSGAKFYTGNTEITMDIDGADVKEFTKPIDISIQIAAIANNPFTGNTVKLGDTLPVYTIEEDATEWTYHGLGTLVAGATADFYNISFKTNHLSSYSIIEFVDLGCDNILDNYNYNITAENLSADFSAPFTIELTYTKIKEAEEGSVLPVGTTKTITLFEIEIEKGKITSIINNLKRKEKKEAANTGTLADIVDNLLIGYENLGTSFDNSYTSAYLEAWKQIANSGKDKDIYFYGEGDIKNQYEYQIFVKSRGQIVRNNISSISTFTDCNLDINLTKGLTPPNLKTIAVGVAGNCGEKNYIPDGIPLFVERDNGVFSYEGTFKKGYLFLYGYELGKEYTFKTIYKGNSLITKWTFDGTVFFDPAFEIPQTACDYLNGL